MFMVLSSWQSHCEKFNKIKSNQIYLLTCMTLSAFERTIKLVDFTDSLKCFKLCQVCSYLATILLLVICVSF